MHGVDTRYITELLRMSLSKYFDHFQHNDSCISEDSPSATEY